MTNIRVLTVISAMGLQIILVCMFILDIILSVTYMISLTDKMGNERAGLQCVE